MPDTCELGVRFLETSRLVAGSSRYRIDLNRHRSETMNLSKPDGTDMVFVARVPGRKSIAFRTPDGRRPMCCAGSGRPLLSRLPSRHAGEALRAGTRPAVASTTAALEGALLRRTDASVASGDTYAQAECCRGDIDAPKALTRPGEVPVGAISFSVPGSRWRLGQTKEGIGAAGRRSGTRNLLETGMRVVPRYHEAVLAAGERTNRIAVCRRCVVRHAVARPTGGGRPHPHRELGQRHEMRFPRLGVPDTPAEFAQFTIAGGSSRSSQPNVDAARSRMRGRAADS